MGRIGLAWGVAVAVILLALGGCGGGKAKARLAPKAAFTVLPASGSVDSLFRFDATASSDPEGTAVQVRWDWENDGAFDTEWNTAQTATHQYSAPGSYVVRLAVKDGDGMITELTQVVAVSLRVVIAPAAAVLTIGQSQTFTSAVDGSADQSVTWSASGGTVDNGVYRAPLTPGTYTVTAASAVDPAQSATATVQVQASSATVTID